MMHLDAGAVLGQPVLNHAGAVDSKPVQDEEDLAAGVPDQALEKADQARSVDRTVGDFPAQFALVGHRRDQAQVGPLVANLNQRCPAMRAQPQPRTSSERRPASSPQKMMARACLARATIAG